jgi:hypothetical protein
VTDLIDGRFLVNTDFITEALSHTISTKELGRGDLVSAGNSIYSADIMPSNFERNGVI